MKLNSITVSVPHFKMPTLSVHILKLGFGSLKFTLYSKSTKLLFESVIDFLYSLPGIHFNPKSISFGMYNSVLRTGKAFKGTLIASLPDRILKLS